MPLFRRLLIFVSVGFLLGTVAASLIAPGYLAWDNTPRNGQALCNCVEVVQNTASSLLRAQLIGGGIGAGALFILGLVLGRPKKPSPSDSQAPAPSTE